MSEELFLKQLKRKARRLDEMVSESEELRWTFNPFVVKLDDIRELLKDYIVIHKEKIWEDYLKNVLDAVLEFKELVKQVENQGEE